MTQALVAINSVAGSNDDLPINTLVQLNNVNVGGELTFNWAILDQPPGPSDVLSAGNIQNPTLTPRKEGSYLIQLIVNNGLPDVQVNTVIAAVRQLKTRQRQPAAGETTQDDTIRGWATSLNTFLTAIDAYLGDPEVIVGVNTSGSTMNRGTVVKAVATAVIKAGLPGQETLPGFSPALATLQVNIQGLLAVVEGDVAGNPNPAAGAIMRARLLGRFASSVVAGGSPGAPVYVTDAGALSNVAGTVQRQVGTVLSVSGGIRDVWFDGVGGFEITPINAPYVVYGNPGMLTNAFRVDGLNATGATGTVAPTFKAGDATTVALKAKRFSSGGADIFQATKEDETTVFYRIGPSGFVEQRTDAADANGVVVGQWQALDENSVAADQRVAQILMKLNGATANNRGGELDVLLKSNGASGLATVATFGIANALSLFAQGSGNGLNATASSGGNAVLGTNSGNGIGVAGQSNGSGPAIFGLAAGTGDAVQGVVSAGNGRGGYFAGHGTGVGAILTKGASALAALSADGPLALSTADPSNPTSGGTTYNGSPIVANTLYPTMLAKAWGTIDLNNGTNTLLEGFNISSISTTSSANMTVNFSKNLADTNYVVMYAPYGSAAVSYGTTYGTKATGSFQFNGWLMVDVVPVDFTAAFGHFGVDFVVFGYE